MLKRSNIKDIYSLSSMQEGILFHALKDEESTAYFEQTTIVIKGHIDRQLLEESFKRVIERYDVFRTVFSYKKSERPMQILLKERDFSNFYRDISDLDKDDQIRFLENFEKEDRKRGFDLTKDILMRVALFKLNTRLYKMVWSYHHIIMDGWCLGIVYGDLIQIYHSLKNGKPPDLFPVFPYSRYIKWLENYTLKEGMAYWEEYLDQYEQKTALPKLKRFENKNKGFYELEKFIFEIDGTLTKKLKKIAEKYRVTINVIFQTLWGILLQKCNNTDDVVFGTVVSGRPPEIPGIERMVGLFINTIPVRVRGGNGKTFSQLLMDVHQKAGLSKKHEYVPLVKIQGCSPLKGNLIDHVVAFQNFPVQQMVQETTRREEDLGFVIEEMENFEHTSYDFHINISPGRENSFIKFTFNSLVYDFDFMYKFALYLEEIARQVVENPLIEVEKIEPLYFEERNRLLYELNDTNAHYPSGKTIHQLFEEQVATVPDNVAIVYEDTCLTYLELNRESNHLAGVLREKMVREDHIVGMLMDRSNEMLIGILGILKAGGAYLPIDPDYPEERINYMLQDSNAVVLVTGHTRAGVEKAAFYRDIVYISAGDGLSPPRDLYRAGSSGPSNLAYVIYTSGTTGKPKGTMIEHKNVVRLMFNDRFQFSFDNRDIWTMFHSHCFDFSVWEMYGALLYGGKLIIIPKMVARDPAGFLKILKKEKVTVLNQTPSAFYNLVQEELRCQERELQVRYVVFGGEALNPLKLKEWKERYPGMKLVNMFGITETTVHVTYKEIGDQEIALNISNIGKPIPTLSVYIMGSNRQLLPIGVPGEICVAGDGLGRGYLNKIQLARSKFVENPYRKGERIYRSGDLGKLLENGEIEYQGRIDHQVKIRGYRIEPGEIETKLLNHHRVKEVVVMAREDKNNHRFLCAYVVPLEAPAESSIDAAELRKYLSQQLPDYMIPTYFVPMGKIPLTANGKVDRKLLPDPVGTIASEEEYVAPANEAQEKLAAIWKQVLSTETIGVTDNFFNVGGDSIKTIRLINLINAEFDTDFKIVDIYTHETIEKFSEKINQYQPVRRSKESEEAIEEIEALKKRIMQVMQDKKVGDNVVDVYPMSDIEKGMVFYSLKETQNPVYHEQFVFQMRYSPFDLKRFEQALHRMVEKHSILRTIFNVNDFGEPVQLVLRRIPVDLRYIDISNKEKTEQEAFIKGVMAEDRKNPFEPTSPPLWRMMTFSLGNDNYCAVFTFHHAILDGWSNASFVTELNNLYLKLKSDPGFVPGKLKCTYKDFIIEQMAEKKKEAARDFWRNELNGYKRLLFPRLKSFEGVPKRKTYYYKLESSFLEKLNAAARRHNTSIKHILFAAYVDMLNMISYENDLVVGLIGNNRPECTDGDKMLGCFLNTVPFRALIPTAVTWSEFIRQVDKKLVELKKYERLSFFEIVRIINEKAGEKNPLFDTVFNYIDFHVYDQVLMEADADSSNDRLAVDGYENTNTLFDLSISTTFGSLDISFYYSNQCFTDEWIKNLGDFFKNILIQMVEEPGSPVKKHRILSSSERGKLLYEFNDTKKDYFEERTVQEVFEEQSAGTPANWAVVGPDPGKNITYKKLDQKANQLARTLRTRGVTAGTIVALAVERSIGMIVGILGILKAGGAYLPLDPEYPRERVNHMMNDSSVEVLIIDDNHYFSEICATVVNIQDPAVYAPEMTNPGLVNTPDDAAYVIYTSGTSGKPKGVILEHKGLLNLKRFFEDSYHITTKDRILQFARLSFDASVWETFMALFNGAALYLINTETIGNYLDFEAFLVNNGITIATLPPTYLVHLDPNVRTSLRMLITAGSETNFELVDRWKTWVRYINAYGPTETTICATDWHADNPGGQANTVPIGKPVSNTRIYILDRNYQLQPIEVVGELSISGVGLARGYLNRVELTDEKFVDHPFEKGRKLYRTGDLARWLLDGNIEFFHRIDHQVKIRGYRIELGEIENQLLEVTGIKEAVVVAREESRGDKYLCAYVVGERPLDAVELRGALAVKLPDYMVPVQFVQLERMPLTPNGKIDRKALPKPEIGVAADEEDYIAPGDETEEKLVKIWSNILGLDQEIISVDDNFFELGGHSLKAIELISRIHKEFDIKIPLVDIFDLPTIEELAKFIKGAKREIYEPIPPVEKKDYYEVTAAQRRMYFVELVTRDLNYNMPIFLVLEGNVDLTRIEKAFKQLIQRHQCFRTTVEIVAERLVQRVHDQVEFGMEYYEAEEENAEAIIRKFVRLFNFSEAPLMRAGVIKVKEKKYIFMIDIHHIIVDLGSMSVLIREFGDLYAGRELPGLKIHYKDYSEWQNSAAQKEAVKKQETYWMREFEGELPVMELPLDFPRPPVQNFEGERIEFELTSHETRRLKELVVQEKSTLFIMLLSVYNIMLSIITGQDDLLVGTFLMDRRHEDLRQVIGMFVNILVLRNFPFKEDRFIEFIKKVKKRTLKAFENQQYEFDDFLDNLGLERNISRNPLVDAMFEFQNYEAPSHVDSTGEMTDFKIRPYQYDFLLAKFDIGLYCKDMGENLNLTFRYCKKLFKRETISRFVVCFKKVLTSVLETPHIRLSEIEIISEADKEKILSHFNDTNTVYPHMKIVTELFEEQVARTPNRTALVEADSTCFLTYRELNHKANHIAHVLRSKQVRSDTILPIMDDRSDRLMIGILAILKSGGAFLPIDPGYPDARKKFIIEDSESRLLLTDGYLFQKDEEILQSLSLEDILFLDDDTLFSGASSNPKMINKPQDLAYIIYTSGSTGNPKGVLIEHRSVVNYIWWAAKMYVKNENLNFPLFTSISFDLTVTSIFTPLVTGNTMVIYGDEDKEFLLERIIDENKVGAVKLTPSHLKLIGDKKIEGVSSGIRRMIVGGEELETGLAKGIFQNFNGNIEINNEYGPTETAVGCMIHRFNPEKDNKRAVSIGRPADNVQIYILDENRKLLPPGVSGEICISGNGVARGYLNRPNLTTERFVENPFVPGTRMYRSGDLGRWMLDGTIEFLGRKDSQVKIRGFRIELGEIENQLLHHPDIFESLVIARGTIGSRTRGVQKGDKILCAYIAADREFDNGELREFLSTKLPDYMIPLYFVNIEKIPLTVHGKVDTKNLPEPVFTLIPERFIPPSDPYEKKMVTIWSNILDIEEDIISMNANFFELGGHSLKATILVSRIHKEFNVKVPLVEIFKAPFIKELCLYIRGASEERYSAVEIAEKREYYLLSNAQKRLYILQQMEINSTVYNMLDAIEMEGEPSIEKLTATFKYLIKRHESFRTSFVMVGHQPVQKIHEDVDFQVEYVDLSNTLINGSTIGVDGGESLSARINRAIWDFVTPFDLAAAPLLRAGLIKAKEGKHILVVDMHHIITDGVSHQIVIRDFMAVHEGNQLPSLRIQYKDYAVWQNSENQKNKIQQQETYWLEEFSGEIPVLYMPLDHPRPAIQSFEGSTLIFEIPNKEKTVLEEIAMNEGATLFMVILAVFNIFLSKISGQEDIIVGTPVAGRKHWDFEEIIGMFVNTLALRSSPFGEKPFIQFLGEVRKKTLDAFENQEYQFEDLVEKVEVRRDASRNPLFDVMFSLQNIIEVSVRTPALDVHGQNKSPDTMPGLNQYQYEFENRISKFDLTFDVIDRGKNLSVNVEYCSRLFEEKTIWVFVEYFKRIVTAVVESPAKKIDEIEVISEHEKHQLLYRFNDTAEAFPEDKTLHQLFEEQVVKNPGNVAVVGPNSTGSLTYEELNKRANRLARALREKGVNGECIVALKVKRSIEMIMAILGVLKTGGAYLPFDPEYPEERIEYMLADSEAHLLLTEIDLYADLPRENQNLNINVSPNHLAYIIYTSGSTGTPKGVMIEHSSVINLVNCQKKQFQITESERVLQFSSISFDASVEQIFITLFSGAALVLIDRDELLNPDRFEAFVSRYLITHMHAVPSFLKILHMEEHYQLKRVIAGGDTCPVSLARSWYHVCDFYNEYGPTETTVTSIEMTIEEIRENQVRLPIGKPISNTRIYLLDRWANLVPAGTIGELYIGGAGVARGYLNRPVLTTETFLPDPFIAGEYLYRTGDMARWLSDGNIEFLGRMDRQIKVRGYRIELQEIENRLLKHGGIREAAVLLREVTVGNSVEGPKEGQLCAYFVAGKSLQGEEFLPSQLKEHLSDWLPDYMIPTTWTRLDKIPSTPSGKIDRKALPEPVLQSEVRFVAPRDEVEERLVEIWSEVLGIKKERIGITDNFFKLGGHSLRSISLVSKVHKEFNVKISLAEIFKTPVIKTLSQYIKEAGEDKYASIQAVEEKEYYRLSSAQKRLYILQQMDVENIAYNMPEFIDFEYEPDRASLEKAFKKLIHRHEGLRTSFHVINEESVQKVHEAVEFKLEYHEAQHMGGNDGVRKSALPVEAIMENFVRPFDLSQAPLVRGGLIKKEGAGYLLMVDMHHIISDGISHNILVKDFMALNKGDDLFPLRIQYKDFAGWQQGIKQGEGISHQEAYWLKEFEGEIPVLNLSTDYARPAIQSFEGEIAKFDISTEYTEALRRIALEEGVTLYMVTLALFNVLLLKTSGQEDIVIGSPVAGRRHDDLEHIIGMFVNTLALRNYPNGEKSFKKFLAELKARTLKAFENQEYQFEDLVDILSVNRDTGRNPLFDIMFTLHALDGDPGQVSDEALIEEDTTEPGPAQFGYEDQTAKFDLTLTGVETVGKLFFHFQYCTRLFKKETINRFISYFKRIVSWVAKDPGMQLGQIEIISEEEKQHLLYDFNDTAVEYPEDKTICHLFTESAAKVPANPAVIGPNTRDLLRYAELNERANQLARLIRKRGMNPGSIVGIMVTPSVEMLVGILAVLKAGCAYLPIDPDYPDERIKYMLKDSSAGLLLCQQELFSIAAVESPILDFKDKNLDTCSRKHLKAVSRPTDPAYVIYTSGSTGRPKGVIVQHRSLTNLCDWHISYYSVTAEDRGVKYAGFGFDASVWEIFPYLVVGASIYMIPEDIKLEPDKLNIYFESNHISIAFLPTQICEQFMELENHSLRFLLTGGDKLNHYVKRDYKLANNYGPTENTVVSTSFTVDQRYENIPIGRPIHNTQVFILDKSHRLQPVGTAGEICLSGSNLALGYLNRPGLTEKTFVENPYIKGEQLYGTGDLGRWLPEGNIEFLGRIDQQVKIRGYRIEMGEIENRVLHHEVVKEAVVVAREDGKGEKYLCCYVVSSILDSTDEMVSLKLREYLSKELPAYMIPAYFVILDAIPLTTNGKVDKKALPEPLVTVDENHAAPRNRVEERLVGLWSELLSIPVEGISIDANFFELGGHSLKATMLVSKIFREFNIKLPLVEVFRTPTIRNLAEYVVKMEQVSVPGKEDNLMLLEKYSDQGSNLFLVHDGSGEVDQYVEFCRSLNGGFNCWGIRVDGDRFKDLTPLSLTIEELGESYINKIKTIQPRGLYTLVGWSLGGTIAVEMVRQLENQGEMVSLILIDSPAPGKNLVENTVPFTIESELDFIHRYLPDLKVREKLGTISGIEQVWPSLADYLENTDSSIHLIRNLFPRDVAQMIPNFEQQDIRGLIYYLNVTRSLARARALYMPREKINTTVHYFGASQSKELMKDRWDNYCTRAVNYYEVTGNHFSIMKMPEVKNWIQQFNLLVNGE